MFSAHIRKWFSNYPNLTNFHPCHPGGFQSMFTNLINSKHTVMVRGRNGSWIMDWPTKGQHCGVEIAVAVEICLRIGVEHVSWLACSVFVKAKQTEINKIEN